MKGLMLLLTLYITFIYGRDMEEHIKRHTKKRITSIVEYIF